MVRTNTDIEWDVVIEAIVEAWRKNQAATMLMLSWCGESDWDLKPGSGKTIRSNFVHLISVRRHWVEGGFKAGAADIPKLDWQSATRHEIEDGLERSYQGVVELMRRRNEKGKDQADFLAYAVAHEAHHRSQIEIALRQAGRAPDDLTLFKLWDWSKL